MHQTTSDKASSDLLERMLGEIEDYAMIFLDSEGIITRWNKGAQAIKGYSEEEAVGKHIEIFYSKEDRDSGLPRRLIKDAVANGKAVHEGWRLRKNGSFFWGAVVITTLHDDNGKVVGFAKVTRDLTDKKLAEDSLREKNQQLERTNAELSSFAYIASHDLQEPLRKIQTFLSRINDLEKGRLSEKSVDYFNRIQNAGERMQQLIEDLLAYSRTNLDESKMQQVDLNQVIADVQRDLSEAIADKHAMVQVASPLPTVRGIPFQLQQLFTNLLSNSLKFSKGDVKPVIQLSSSLKTLDSRKTFNCIRVEDNGIGFEEEFREKIFELFQRLHGRSEYPGTGIGLAIVKKIVVNHGGTIQATSVPGEGATFEICLPVSSK